MALIKEQPSFIHYMYEVSPSLHARQNTRTLSQTARYRLKYCHKGPLSPKQPTNQPINIKPRDGLSNRIHKSANAVNGSANLNTDDIANLAVNLSCIEKMPCLYL